jgi:hypothetical protein
MNKDFLPGKPAAYCCRKGFLRVHIDVPDHCTRR